MRSSAFVEVAVAFHGLRGTPSEIAERAEIALRQQFGADLSYAHDLTVEITMHTGGCSPELCGSEKDGHQE